MFIMATEFWSTWKNKTETEKRAIKSISIAQKTLFENVSKDKIYAIYIKGSFVRREMNSKSDVDIIPITYDNATLEKIREIQQNKGQIYAPSELLPHSLKEFEKGKRHLRYGSPKGGVDVTLRNIYQYKLLYGKHLDITKYSIRSDEDFLIGHIHAFKTTFIPLYKKNKLGFSQLMKQVFFLVEREERVKGNNPPDSWKALAKSIKDKNHMVHEALRYRLHPTKDLKERKRLLIKLNKYLGDLNKLI
jgi:predicted nucleotidyltransferase